MPQRIEKRLEDFKNKSWESFTHHCEVKLKLLFWIGGILFSAIIGAFLLIAKDSFVGFKLDFELVLGFHVFVIALLLLVIHQSLSCRIYLKLVGLAEGRIHQLGINPVLQSITQPYIFYRNTISHDFKGKELKSVPSFIAFIFLTFLYQVMLLVALGLISVDSTGNIRLIPDGSASIDYLILFASQIFLYSYHQTASNSIDDKIKIYRLELTKLIDQDKKHHCNS